MSGLSYKAAGVDIEEGDRLVELIKPLVRRTFRPEVMTDIGSFGALFKLDIKKYKEPVLISGTDGVGTKLKIAFMANRHDTIGIDLVAMCVNDILTHGAEPLFFLDYFATGKLNADNGAMIVKGIVKGCEESGCALIGGETAEMPGFYKEDEYDLAGFAVGVVDKPAIVDGSNIKDGDALIGIPSSGIHSNGYSLVRKIFFDKERLGIHDRLPGLDVTLEEELLRPTRIYVKAVKALLESGIAIKGMAHITGGGITGNVPRILPDGLDAAIDLKAWPEPPVFTLMRDMGKVEDADMRRTFNMGIGYVLAVKKEEANKTLDILSKIGYYSYIIGEVRKGTKEGKTVKYADI